MKRILILNMVAMHSTSFTTANTILDILSSKDWRKTLQQLREEGDCTLREAKGEWTKEIVTKLYHTDSAIRESMRRSAFGIAALPRIVSSPDGLDLCGTKVPQGVRLAVAMHEVHHDTSFYPDPTIYDAFRFSRSRSREASRPEKGFVDVEAQSDDDEGNPFGARDLSATTVSDHFLSFGYGRRACPGRFFAVHEMKILLSLLVQRYDFEPLSERPQDRTLVEVKVPAESTTIRMRRRMDV